MTPLDLRRSRDLGAILDTALSAWRRHFGVFFALALIVVAPVMVLVDGLWAGTLGDFGATPDLAPSIASGLCSWILIPALVTAMHVVAVEDLGRGVEPTIRHSLGVAVRVFPRVALILLLYGLAVMGGSVLCIAPGVFLGVRWYFGLQSAVVEGRRGPGALKRSAELVENTWWRVFGILLVVFLIGLLLGVPLALIGVGLGVAGADPELLVAVLQVLWNALTVSFTALATTLLFFDRRVRFGLPPAPEPVMFAPEHPHPA